MSATKADPKRRRKGAVGQKRRKLAVNEDALDRKNFSYRFVNDTGNRVHDMTVNDDWEVVPQAGKSVKEDGTDLGSSVSTVVGKDNNGQPIRGYLLRKPLEWFEEDKAASQAALDEQMKAIKRGRTPGGGLDPDSPTTYPADGGIKIG